VIYLDGEEVTDLDTFFDNIKANIGNAETTGSDPVKLALCVKRTDLKMAPVKEVVGWSETDPDDEFCNSAINVNEPFVVTATTADGEWYYGMSTNCKGWVPAECFAICDSRIEWAEMWNCSGENALYVTTGKITLEESNLAPQTSCLELMLGTKLPLVPMEEIVDADGNHLSIAERGTWYNYVVYVPTRDENGKFVKSYGLVDIKENVSIGELPFTKRNVLKVAFNCLGDRYGWGGMLGALDCSLYTRSIYRCFGFELPRNTTWQCAIPTDNITLTGMSDKEKALTIKALEPGTLLEFEGHITMYVGEDNGKLYVISALGNAAEADEYDDGLTVLKWYTVSVNTLDIRRGNGTTWLENMRYAIRPWKNR
ncbi:MAG: SH3 domain-containing protein, partial [Lachnospiraceae bacterium]|nr:SH3 domain-containing protein [Lachnospiraceae bacterium]